eukprot:10544837-Heterocapsa_arctica.AAC.1
MDGGEDDDGTMRERVEIASPVDQPHVERERCRATAESRQPLIGGAAYRDLPLTGAFQSTFPAYRQRISFGLLDDAAQLTNSAATDDPDPFQSRRTKDIFRVDEHGQIVEIVNPDGKPASVADLEADAK